MGEPNLVRSAPTVFSTVLDLWLHERRRVCSPVRHAVRTGRMQ